MRRRVLLAIGLAGPGALGWTPAGKPGRPAAAAEAARYSFGYDQPHGTGYGIAADIFGAELERLSGGTMAIDQFPGAQLGQEPQMLQKSLTGDIDFTITTTANAATVSPEAAVMSLHYLFRDEDHLARSLADPAVVGAMRGMTDDTVRGARALALVTLGLRDVYGRREVRGLDDLKGRKVRVQATATEDTIFAAYGAQTVHMPFGSVYTSLQTGVMDFAENAVNVYLADKHYEVAPVLSATEHEANNSILWVSDKLWSRLSEQQRGWVQAAADECGRRQPAEALGLAHDSTAKLRKMGVKVVAEVDKSAFAAVATPIQDASAKQLGPHAERVLALVRAVR